MKHLTHFLFAISIAFFFSSPLVQAHDGDHSAPGMIEAPRGGEIKAIENVYIEVLAKGSEVKIYLYTKDLKPVTDVKPFTLSTEAQLPRGKTSQALPLHENGGVYSTTFDAKGAHRFNLILKIRDSRQKHDDRLVFTIEPRRP